MEAFTGQRERWILSLFATLIIGFVAYSMTRNTSAPPTLVMSPEPIPSQTPTAGAKPEERSEQLVLHVTGAVKKPGVIKVNPGCRVYEAIDKAGGATSSADLSLLNLAAKVEDGMQIVVLTKDAPTPAEAISPASGTSSVYSTPSSGGTKVAVRSGKVSLNTATSAELDTLPGVGPSTAAKILDYRREHGGFATIDELLSVKGIGPKKLEAMRKFLKL